MLFYVGKGGKAAWEQDGVFIGYIVGTLSGKEYNYVMLDCFGEGAIMKLLPANRFRADLSKFYKFYKFYVGTNRKPFWF